MSNTCPAVPHVLPVVDGADLNAKRCTAADTTTTSSGKIVVAFSSDYCIVSSVAVECCKLCFE